MRENHPGITKGKRKAKKPSLLSEKKKYELEIERMEEASMEIMEEKDQIEFDLLAMKKWNREMKRVLRKVLRFWPDRSKCHPDVKILLGEVKNALEEEGTTI